MSDIPPIDDSIKELIARTSRVSCANKLHLIPNHESPSNINLLLIGKILSHRNHLSNVLQEIVLKAWKPACNVTVRKVERNIFGFHFEHEADLKLAFSKIPWTIRGAHLILKHWSPNLTWQEVDFSSSTFWVQVHGPPTLWQQQDFLERIGSKASKVLEVDFIGEPQIHWQGFVRIRVEVDINSPLCPGFFLPRENLDDIWISLKYEKTS